MLEPRECLFCHKLYKPIKANQKYCPVCKAKKMPKAVLTKKKCLVCGKEFFTTIYNKKYCSKDCLDYSKRDWSRLHTHVCQHCGKEFEATLTKQKYCTRECAKEAKSSYDKAWREKNAVV